MLTFCDYGPKFTNLDEFVFGISAICKEKSEKIAISYYEQIDSRISWDFATNIFEIFRK